MQVNSPSTMERCNMSLGKRIRGGQASRVEAVVAVEACLDEKNWISKTLLHVVQKSPVNHIIYTYPNLSNIRNVQVKLSL